MGEPARAAKKQETRELLVRTALRLFHRQGYEATTLQEIADAAHVSRSTIFRYFASKEDFLFADHAARVGLLRTELAKRLEDMPAFEALRESFLAMAGFWTSNADRILATRRVVNSTPALVAHDALLDRDWEAVIEDAFLRDTGVSTEARFEARVLAGAVMGAIRAALREWDQGAGRDDLVELARQGFALLERSRGFRVLNGRAG